MPPPLPKPREIPARKGKPCEVQDPRTCVVDLGTIAVGYEGIVATDGSKCSPAQFPFDKLRYVRFLGKGSEGSVELYQLPATDAKPASYFAVKKLPARNPTGSLLAQVRQALLPPCTAVAQTFNAVLREGVVMVITEFADGGDLKRALQHAPESIPEAAAAHVARRCLIGLLHCHDHGDRFGDARLRQPAENKNSLGAPGLRRTSSGRKIVHRDLKPANILLTVDGDVKICDFGTACVSDHSTDLASGCGTIAYNSPERASGQTYGAASDVWSLGIIVAEMLLGRHPLRSVASRGGVLEVMREIVEAAPVALGPLRSDEAQDFVDLCLRKSISERATAATLLEHPWIKRHSEADGRLAVSAIVAVDAVSMDASVEGSVHAAVRLFSSPSSTPSPVMPMTRSPMIVVHTSA